MTKADLDSQPFSQNVVITMVFVAKLNHFCCANRPAHPISLVWSLYSLMGFF
jgi:hypothetical protein